MNPDQRKEIVGAALNLIADALRRLNEEERREVMGALNAEFCTFCWWQSHGEPCYCTRDD